MQGVLHSFSSVRLRLRRNISPAHFPSPFHFTIHRRPLLPFLSADSLIRPSFHCRRLCVFFALEFRFWIVNWTGRHLTSWPFLEFYRRRLAPFFTNWKRRRNKAGQSATSFRLQCPSVVSTICRRRPTSPPLITVSGDAPDWKSLRITTLVIWNWLDVLVSTTTGIGSYSSSSNSNYIQFYEVEIAGMPNSSGAPPARDCSSDCPTTNCSTPSTPSA